VPALAAYRPVLRRLEDGLAIAVLGAMVLLPLAEFGGREVFGRALSGTMPLVQHLTLWATFLGAALAARSDRLLALATTGFLPRRWQSRSRIFAALTAIAVTSLLVVASVQLVWVDYQYSGTVAWGLPVWVVSAMMPLGFAAIAVRILLHAAEGVGGRLVAFVGLLSPLLFMVLPAPETAGHVLFWGAILLFATALGMPIFAAIGGVALLLFWFEGTPASAVPGEAYRMATSPMLPAIPLFTLAGYILAEGGASHRLLRFASALVGWMPGGLAVVTTLVLAFFTPLTGASGITILAMGGLLLPMMMRAGYPERHSVGLVTVSGSIGVLFPPSLPVILYAYYAELDLDRLFVGGLLPGLMLVAGVAIWGAWQGSRAGAQRTTFDVEELGKALWLAKWDVLLPVVIIAGIFGGFATLVEAAALTVLYAFVIECLVFRELDMRRDLPAITVESVTLVGGFMIILGVALGLTNYLIIDQVPMHALEWVKAYIESPWLFLLAINVLLIVVGALMDIYSAIIVIVPLIVPMAAAYGVDPVHLGIIFMANAQLGYLMPPMGENLFLSAYRFKQSLPQVYVSTLPYVLILLVIVLLVTYVPVLTLGTLDLFGM